MIKIPVSKAGASLSALSINLISEFLTPYLLTKGTFNTCLTRTSCHSSEAMNLSNNLKAIAETSLLLCVTHENLFKNALRYL
ncbi:Uncharacterised protein [Mycoplasmopsis edwardii]|uniref:Uncharacterized protein n=1 Tax=Mycoplasmopsis edwardii TaxID=53558 RepID=A0A3B0PIR6_9BACT|nr:Uncharacterised protein [Mycoplasmopsis edwardii]